MKNKCPPTKPTGVRMAKYCGLIVGGIVAAVICFIALVEYFYPIQLL